MNYIVDLAAENTNSFFLDSKDARCFVCGDITPVLKPDKTWINFEILDHIFHQSRVSGVMLMTLITISNKLKTVVVKL